MFRFNFFFLWVLQGILVHACLKVEVQSPFSGCSACSKGQKWTLTLIFYANVDKKSLKYSEEYGKLNIFHFLWTICKLHLLMEFVCSSPGTKWTLRWECSTLDAIISLSHTYNIMCSHTRPLWDLIVDYFVKLCHFNMFFASFPKKRSTFHSNEWQKIWTCRSKFFTIYQSLCDCD